MWIVREPFSLTDQTLMECSEWFWFHKPGTWGHKRGSLYYDPPRDSQSNFPAAKKWVERLQIWEADKRPDVLRDSWFLGSVALQCVVHVWAHRFTCFLDTILIYLHLFRPGSSISGEIRNGVFAAQSQCQVALCFFSRPLSDPVTHLDLLRPPLIQPLTSDPRPHLLLLSRSGHWQARDVSRRSARLRGQRGAPVAQTGGAGRRGGSGNGGRAGVAPAHGPSSHRPVLPPPRLANWGAARGDRQGAAAAPPQPGHRQRSVTRHTHTVVTIKIELFEFKV